ncbi:MAG: desulfoferrodoxin [Lachnospiraceae bacterium]|nr:desulfoferrodoxin [Lachnospiraceae bacterium]
MEQKFYKCEHCGNIIAMVKNTGVPVVCCGEKMKEIVPGTVDASLEKHVPTFEIKNNIVYVTVGAVLHPMEEKHFIEWISIQTSAGNQRKVLTPGSEPKAQFAICEGETVEVVYAYCNLHGLWKA